MLYVCRNKDIRSLDETYWEKSFVFHTMLQPPGSQADTEDGDTGTNKTKVGLELSLLYVE